MMQRRRSGGVEIAVVLSALVLLAYPGSYAALRLTHVLVHSSLWSSQEGLDFHHDHSIDATAARWLSAPYTPLIWLETRLHELRQP